MVKRKRKSVQDTGTEEANAKRQKTAKQLVKEGKCQDCEVFGHESCYVPACDLYIPVEERPRQTTVTCSIAGRINDRSFLDVIEHAADTISKIRYLICQLVLAHNTRLLNRGDDPINVDRSFLRSVFACIVENSKARTNKPSDELVDTYNQVLSSLYIGRDFKFDTTGLGSIMDIVFVEMQTFYSNYDDYSLQPHVSFYLRAKYGVNKTLAGALANKVCSANPGVFETPMKSMGDVPLDHWNNVIVDEHKRYLDACAGEKKNRSASIAKYRFKMMKVIEKYNTERPKNEHVKGMQLYPTMSMGRQFIPMDKKSVNSLAVLARELHPYDDRDHIDALFTSLDTLFDRSGDKEQDMSNYGKGNRRITREQKKCRKPRYITAKEKRMKAKSVVNKNKRGNGTQWRLGAQIRTNGVELHITWETASTRRSETGKLCKKTRREIIRDIDVQPGYSFDGLWEDKKIRDWNMRVYDPNTNAPFVGCRVDYNGEFHHKTFTKQSFYRHAKRGKLKVRDEKDRKRYGLDSTIELMSRHTLKSSSWEAIRKAVEVRLRHLESLHDIYSHRKRLKLRFQVRSAEKAAIDKIVTFLRGKYSPKRLVVVGNASSLTGVRGTSPGVPFKKVYNRAIQRSRREGWHFRFLDEYKTSKLAHCCEDGETKSMKTTQMSEKRKKKGGKWVDEQLAKRRSNGKLVPWKVHGICICTKCNCVYNRDTNASRNQMVIAQALLHGKQRPQRFMRPKKNLNPTINLDGHTSSARGALPSDSRSPGPFCICSHTGVSDVKSLNTL